MYNRETENKNDRRNYEKPWQVPQQIDVKKGGQAKPADGKGGKE